MTPLHTGQPAGIPLLLFRQVALLAFIAGVFACRHLFPASVAFIILLCLAWKTLGTPYPNQAYTGNIYEEGNYSHPSFLARIAPHIPALVVLTVCFFVGGAYAVLRSPVPPQEPAWLASFSGQGAQTSLEDAAGKAPELYIAGTVGKILPTAGDRYRFLLHDSRLVQTGPTETRLATTGLIAPASQSIRSAPAGRSSELSKEPLITCALETLMLFVWQGAKPFLAGGLDYSGLNFSRLDISRLDIFGLDFSDLDSFGLPPDKKDKQRDPNGINQPFPMSSFEPTEGYPQPEDIYTGSILVTLYAPEVKPLTGQQYESRLKISRVRSFANKGTPDFATWWGDQGVYFRAWSGWKQTATGSEKRGLDNSTPGSVGFAVSGEPDTLAQWRNTLVEKFYAALPLSTQVIRQAGKSPYMLTREERYAPLYGSGAALLPALLFGDRSFIAPEQNDLIARATIIHSLSISGLHLAYAVTIGFIIVSCIGYFRPGIFLRVPKPYLSMLLALPFAAVYAWLGEAPVSLLRSGFMFVFWGLLLFAGRPKVLLDGLLAAVFLILLMNPIAAFDLGLQLSALSVATIALALPGITCIVNGLVPHQRKGELPQYKKNLRNMFSLLLLSFSIQFALTPVTLSVFGQIGLWFPLNLIWLPVLGALVMPLTFAALFASTAGLHSVAQLLLAWATKPCDALLYLLSSMDNLGILYAPAALRPHWLSMYGFWLLCIATSMLVAWYREKTVNRAIGVAEEVINCKKYLALALIGVLLVCGPLFASYQQAGRRPVSISVLDVGQGQAVLLSWAGGRALIDGGGVNSDSFDIGRSVIGPVLTDNEPASVTLLANTHPDHDHLAGLMYLMEYFGYSLFAHNGDLPFGQNAEDALHALAKASSRNAVFQRWKQGDTVRLSPELTLEVLWPPEPEVQKEGAKDPDALKRAALAGVPRSETMREQYISGLEKNIRDREGASRSESTNDRSLVIQVRYRGTALALLCGDAGRKTLGALVERYGRALGAQVLVLPHHGSTTGMDPRFYEAVNPQLAIASCGYQNQWGFPTEKVRENLRRLGIPLMATSALGQISLEWQTPERFTLSTARKQETAE